MSDNEIATTRKHDLEAAGPHSLGERIRGELAQPLGAERQKRYKRFLLAAMGGIPWVGSFIAAAATLESEREQSGVNQLQQEWLEEHQEKLRELTRTLLAILQRLENLGDDIEARLQSDEYLGLVRKAFRTWDQADTTEKRELVRNLVANAGGTPLTPDDVIRLFIQWIDYYHEAHFAVIRAIHQRRGATRAAIWNHIHGTQVREDSAEADLFKLLIRDLSTGGVIRQHREVNYDGEFVRKTAAGRPSGAASRTMKSAFDDADQYELTELGNQFVHYTMNDIVPRIGT